MVTRIFAIPANNLGMEIFIEVKDYLESRQMAQKEADAEFAVERLKQIMSLAEEMGYSEIITPEEAEY